MDSQAHRGEVRLSLRQLREPEGSQPCTPQQVQLHRPCRPSLSLLRSSEGRTLSRAWQPAVAQLCSWQDLPRKHSLHYRGEERRRVYHHIQPSLEERLLMGEAWICCSRAAVQAQCRRQGKLCICSRPDIRTAAAPSVASYCREGQAEGKGQQRNGRTLQDKLCR